MYRFLGFLCVAALAVGFADYVTQAKSEGAEIGTFPISAYMGSIQTRIQQTATERDRAKRQGELAKVHLPEALEGWERRAWVRDIEAEHQAMLDQLGAQERALAEQVSNGFIGKMDRKKAIKAAEVESAAQIWEYAKGDEVIRINAKYDPLQGVRDSENTAKPMVASVVEGYAVIHGLPFFKSVDLNAEGDREEQARPIHLWAYMGDAISLHVHAQASEDAIRLILGGIDYDGLNAMLDVPLDGVGSIAPRLTPEQESAVVRAALKARFQEDAKEGQTGPSDDETQSVVSGTKEKMKQLLDTSKGTTDERAKDIAAPTLANPPTRVKLSGGRDCLTGAAGSFCKE